MPSSEKAYGSQVERKVSQDLDGRRQPLSGALSSAGLSGFAGDVLAEPFLVECKARDKKNVDEERVVMIKNKWVKGINKEASHIDLIPAVYYKCKHSHSAFVVMKDNWFNIIDEDFDLSDLDESYMNKKSISIIEDELKSLLLKNDGLLYDIGEQTYVLMDYTFFKDRVFEPICGDDS